jgi:hypothetical protein
MSLGTLKSLVTTAILALALIQALGMLQVRGYVGLLPVKKRRLRQLHRWGGIAVLVLTGTVAVICMSGFGYVLYSPRVKAHVVMGGLAILVLLVKVAISHRFRRYLRYLGLTLVLGAAAGLFILGVFVTSALWYFLQVA